MTRISAASLIVAVGAVVALATVFISRSSANKRQWDLTAAAGRGDLAEVKRLVAAAAKIDAFPQSDGTEGGSPALPQAVEGGHDEVVRFFIEHGADLEISFSDLRSPLAAAIGRRHYSTAALLLTYGASVNHAVGQVLRANSWEPPLDPKMFELLKKYGAITETKFKRVPPMLFFCTGRVCTETEIARYLDRAVPASYSVIRSAGLQEEGLLHVNYTGRNLRHPGSFYLEVAVPVNDSKYPLPDGYYFRTATEFRCFTGETMGLRKNIDFGAMIIEARLWTDGKVSPTFDMRELYRRWKSADAKETIVEIQLGVYHANRDEHGKRYEIKDNLFYEAGE